MKSAARAPCPGCSRVEEFQPEVTVEACPIIAGCERRSAGCHRAPPSGGAALMRPTIPTQVSLLLTVAALTGCPGVGPDNVACLNDAQCPIGYFCANAFCTAVTPDGGSTADAGPSMAVDAGGAGDAGMADAGPQDADAGTADAGADDAGAPDGGSLDAGQDDAGLSDAGPADAGPPDSGEGDAGPPDAGPVTVDAGEPDAGDTTDAGRAPDAGSASDAGPTDAGPAPTDAGPTDAGPPPCEMAGYTRCGATCENLQDDPANCGVCGMSCGTAGSNEETPVCLNGHCSTPCDTGFTMCGGSCVNLGDDSDNCGMCGNSCGGQTCCGGTCADTSTDPGNCGTCGNVCAWWQPNCGGGNCCGLICL